MNACITGSAYEAAELFAKGALKPNFELKRNHHGRPPYSFHASRIFKKSFMSL